jgi:ketosteroid isomerase-like protein
VEGFTDRGKALHTAGLEEEAMSQENVETMRAALAAFGRRDGKAFGALLDKDAEIVPVRAALEGIVYRGPAAGMEYCAAVDASWEDLTWEIEDVRHGEDWVLALGRIRGRGRDSGANIDARGGWVARFRAGLITNFQTHSNRAAALKAVGLEG